MKTNSHMHDFDAHAKALDADMEYYYTKRLLPVVFQLFRKRYVDLYDFQRYEAKEAKSEKFKPRDYEARLRNLEDRFDEFVKGVNRIGPGWAAFKDVNVLTDDVRRERGDYEEFFHITKRERAGDLKSRVDAIEKDLRNYQQVLDAVTSVLLKNGMLDKSVLKRLKKRKTYPSLLNGAKIVSRAWTDPSFKEKLLEHAREAVRDLGIPPGRLGQLQVVENTENVHNVIVCTLCSCYPYDLLGNAPWWYKQDQYKTRIVAQPRKVLNEMFKFSVPENMEIKVHDSTSDIRYMVLPRRPDNTEGMSEEELEKLVTRECLIGTGEPLTTLKTKKK